MVHGNILWKISCLGSCEKFDLFFVEMLNRLPETSNISDRNGCQNILCKFLSLIQLWISIIVHVLKSHWIMFLPIYQITLDNDSIRSEKLGYIDNEFPRFYKISTDSVCIVSHIWVLQGSFQFFSRKFKGWQS